MDNQILNKLHTTLNDLLLVHIACDNAVSARHELSRVRLYMMRHLYENPGVSFSRLSELTFTDRASTSRMIYSMEKEGLVRRQPSEGDRRVIALSLTDAGRAKCEEAESDFSADIQARFSSIDPDDLPGLLRSAQALREAMELHCYSQEDA